MAIPARLPARPAPKSSAPSASSSAAATKWSEGELLERVLRRQEAAWTELVRRYRSLIYRCITKVTSKYAPRLPAAELDEIYAEILLALLRDDMHKIRMYDPERGAKLSSWLGTITVSTTHDYLRSVGRRPVLDHIDGEAASREEEERTPLDLLLEKERWTHFNGLLSDFSEKDRTFLSLYYGQGLDAECIADHMDISIKTVYTKKHKIRQHLRRQLERTGECSAISDLAA